MLNTFLLVTQVITTEIIVGNWAYDPSMLDEILNIQPQLELHDYHATPMDMQAFENTRDNIQNFEACLTSTIRLNKGQCIFNLAWYAAVAHLFVHSVILWIFHSVIIAFSGYCYVLLS